MAGGCAVTVFSPTSILRLTERNFAAGSDISEIHRSTILLATGKERLPIFHGPGFFPLYVVTADIEAQALFEVGANSLLYALEPFQDLPFTDFAADMVVLDVGAFPKHLLRGVVTEAVRILAQLTSRSSAHRQAGKLVVAGSYAHSFVRRLGVVPGVQRMRDETYVWRAFHWTTPKKPMPGMGTPGFKSIFGPEIASRFSPNKSVENQRLKWPKTLASAKCHKNSAGTLWMGWRVFPTEEEGVWKIRESGTCQVANAPGAAGESWKDQTHFGRWSGIMHIGGRAPSQGIFEDSSYFFGLWRLWLLHAHGSISFQHNWIIPLPVCAACKFDLIHQFAGMNHMKTVDQHDKFLSNMLALLECNGVLFVNDHTAREVWTVLLRQVLELKREQKLAQYVENKDGYFEMCRNC